ncbi:MAG: hypothetical protein LBQ19_06740 [Synergistaceae bacterium]|jgi:hypothetical protein|nr:hypothetical protein [Synergistaceae bacterium]
MGIELIRDGATRIYVEFIGPPGDRRRKLSAVEIAAITAAVHVSSRTADAAICDPTPEEMLAIGMSVGLHEASLAQRPARRMSMWKIAARLGL